MIEPIDTSKFFYQMVMYEPCYCEINFAKKRDLIAFINDSLIMGKANTRYYRYDDGIDESKLVGRLKLTTMGTLTVKF